MSNNTKYNVVVNGETVDTKSKKQSAIDIATDLHAEDNTRVVQVVTTSGTEVFLVQDAPDVAKGAKPWTRTEEFDLELEVPAGYTVAYKRNRVGALVARADDKSGWVVITSDGVTEVANTKEAREFTNALATAHKEKRAAEIEAAEVAKAEAKNARAEEREAKAKAKEAEKAEKAEAKRLAREAKEAEAAASAEAEESVSV